MELKINIDTQNVAQQMVAAMVQGLHNSVVTFAHQKFGAINPQAGAMPFPGPFLGQFPFGGFPGQFPPPGHPYAPFGAPPPPYQQQAFPPPRAHQLNPEAAFVRAQQPPGTPPYTPQKPATEYARLMDELCADQNLINAVENVLKTHLNEFVNTPAPVKY